MLGTVSAKRLSPTFGGGKADVPKMKRRDFAPMRWKSRRLVFSAYLALTQLDDTRTRRNNEFVIY